MFNSNIAVHNHDFISSQTCERICEMEIHFLDSKQRILCENKESIFNNLKNCWKKRKAFCKIKK